MDVSKLLTIDNDLRTITIPPSIEHMGVESDDDVLRLYFVMPRMYNDIDLSDFVVRINYQNANGERDVYLVDDNAAGADEITFSWNIRRKVVAYRGKVRFIVCLKRLDDQGNVLQEFNSSVAALPVLRGLEATESHMEDEYPDIMEQILLRLDKLEQGGTGADCHITYVESPDADGNLVRLRDLESGTYILYGRFICYSIPDAETKLITFGWRFPVVIGRTEAKTYLQCIYPPQNTMQYAEITDTSFERKDVRLLYSPNSNANAEIGQTLVVSAVDDNGKPTDWEYSTPGESTTVNGAVVSSGSDYAVCFAWHDGNPDKEDRKNRFVQLADGGNKITFATSGADICGVTTDTAAFVENYDIASEYTSLVGILGVVTVIDNGSCTVGETCMSDDNGYAVPSTNNMGYRVMERLDETRIRIAVKPNDDMIQRIKRDMDNKLDFSKAQELSDAEKTQARDNIDAASKEDISSLSDKIENLPSGGTEDKSTLTAYDAGAVRPFYRYDTLYDEINPIFVTKYLNEQAANNAVEIINDGATVHEVSGVSSPDGRYIYIAYLKNIDGTTADTGDTSESGRCKVFLKTAYNSYGASSFKPAISDEVELFAKGQELIDGSTIDTGGPSAPMLYTNDTTLFAVCIFEGKGCGGYVRTADISTSPGLDALDWSAAQPWTLSIDGEVGAFNMNRLNGWTDATWQTNNQITYRNNLFYQAVCVNGKAVVLVKSSDGINWEYINTIYTDYLCNFQCEAAIFRHGNGRIWIAVRNGNTSSSVSKLACGNKNYLTVFKVSATGEKLDEYNIPDTGVKPYFIPVPSATDKGAYLLHNAQSRYSIQIEYIDEFYPGMTLGEMYGVGTNYCTCAYPTTRKASLYENLMLMGTNGLVTEQSGASLVYGINLGQYLDGSMSLGLIKKLITSSIDDEVTSDSSNLISSGAVSNAISTRIQAPATAEVGQTIIVAEVDENGKPVKWKAADVASGGSSGWELVVDEELTEDVKELSYTFDSCYDLRVVIRGRWNDANDSLGNANLTTGAVLLNEAGAGYMFSGHLGYIRQEGNVFSTLIEACAANALFPMITVHLLAEGGTQTYSNCVLSSKSSGSGKSWRNGAETKLNKITITNQTDGVLLKSGARITIMRRN